MNFQPKTAEEIKAVEAKRAEQFLIPNKTECDFEVVEATDETSRAGNGMIHVKLHVFHGNGYKIIDDYLLGAMEAKLRHFCETTGMLTKYEAGTLAAADCKGRGGKVVIRVEKAKGDYPAKNVVRDYVQDKEAAQLSPNTAFTETAGDPDVPF